MIFLLLIALVVLGPEKLPEAVRKFTKTYAEFKKTIGGFQNEFRDAIDEPMRELRETANAVRDAAKFDLDGGASAMEKLTPPVGEVVPKTPESSSPVATRSPGLNFGSANPRRQERVARAVAPVEVLADEAPEPSPETAPIDETPRTEDATE